MAKSWQSLFKDLADLDTRVPIALQAAGLEVENAAKLNIFGPGWTPPKSIYQLRRRTGSLRRSIRTVVTKEGGRYVVMIGSSLSYARFVEEGTSLSPPRSYLRKARHESRLAYLAVFNQVLLGKRGKSAGITLVAE